MSDENPWPGVRLVIPTSEGYREPLRATLSLLESHWPGRPPAAVVGRGAPLPDARWSGVPQYGAGLQSRVSWCEALHWYLTNWCEEEVVLLMLDDYGLCGPPDEARLRRALGIVRSQPSVASFHLTHIVVAPCLPTAFGEDVEAYPPWEYSVHTQAAFWRRDILAEVLRYLGPGTIQDFELAGSPLWNRSMAPRARHLTFRSPPGTPYFLDGDPRKSEWAVPYHNLVRGGRWEPAHEPFLAAAGLGGRGAVG